MNMKLLLFESGNEPRTIELIEPMISIGRSGTIQVKGAEISRVHLTLIKLESSYLLVDGNNRGKHSENGVRINGKFLKAHLLQCGDFVNLSNKVYFEFVCDRNCQEVNSGDTQPEMASV